MLCCNGARHWVVFRGAQVVCVLRSWDVVKVHVRTRGYLFCASLHMHTHINNRCDASSASHTYFHTPTWPSSGWKKIWRPDTKPTTALTTRYFRWRTWQRSTIMSKMCRSFGVVSTRMRNENARLYWDLFGKSIDKVLQAHGVSMTVA